MKNLEVLSPAGDIDSFYSAISAGADAVYLGMDSFNAREKAKNFNKDNIFEVVKYAHLFGVKVYLTLNTLVNDKELQEVLDLVEICIRAKIDAYIVQDFGIVKILKENFDDVIIHASTQMGIHNLYGAKIVETMGIKRVVLSRETSLEDIIQIKQNTNLEIEFFVQGALCVAFSGNCYLSSKLFGSSGNRGRCKQLCRLCYSGYQDKKMLKKGYLLSCKDLCLLSKLPQLIDAGVQSFKIEGRLRRQGYVAGATSVYRQILNKIQNNTISNNDCIEGEKVLRQLFSRGDFNINAYLNNDSSGIINIENQNHTGQKIGTVTKIEKFKNLYRITIKSKRILNSGDGLKFFVNSKEICSLGVGNVNKLANNTFQIFSKFCPPVESEVFLTLDSMLETKFLWQCRKIDISLDIIAKENMPLVVSAQFQNIKVFKKSDFLLEKANNPVDSKLQLTEQFSKVGNTHFNIRHINIDCDEVFIAKSVANSFRRELLEKLETEIIKHNENNNNAKLKTKIININTKNYLLKNIKNIYLINKLNKNKTIANSPENIVIYCPQIYTKDNFNMFIDFIKNNYNNCEFGLYLPIIANKNDIIILQDMLKNTSCYVVANNLYGFMFSQNKVIAGIGLNAFNDYSLQMLSSLGAVTMIKSAEDICNSNFENRVYTYEGNLPLMTFAHCPVMVLYDNDCKHCAFKENINYETDNGKHFVLKRIKLSKCYFSLLAQNKQTDFAINTMIDCRE